MFKTSIPRNTIEGKRQKINVQISNDYDCKRILTICGNGYFRDANIKLKRLLQHNGRYKMQSNRPFIEQWLN